VAVPDAANLEEIGEAECLRLLESHSVGRIAVVQEGRPYIFPVNYIVDERTVAFRTDPGTKLDAATLGPVAFEIDATDPLYHEGWSVMVRGVGREVTHALDEWSQRVTERHLAPWAAGAKEHWIAIASPAISGRRIRH
jgi:uncharacterized protein